MKGIYLERSSEAGETCTACTTLPEVSLLLFDIYSLRPNVLTFLTQPYGVLYPSRVPASGLPLSPILPLTEQFIHDILIYFREDRVLLGALSPLLSSSYFSSFLQSVAVSVITLLQSTLLSHCRLYKMGHVQRLHSNLK